MKRILTRVVLLGTLVATGSVFSLGCNNGTSTPVTPAAPTVVATTETFSGTIQQLGTATFTFAVALANGTVSVGLTSVGPLSTMALGVGIGTWDGATCTSITKNDNSKAGLTALSGIAAAGNYCVQVYDSGNIPDSSSATFSLQVIHF